MLEKMIDENCFYYILEQDDDGKIIALKGNEVSIWISC